MCNATDTPVLMRLLSLAVEIILFYAAIGLPYTSDRPSVSSTEKSLYTGA